MVFFQLKPRRRSKGLHDLFLFKISFADLEKEKRQMFESKERSRDKEVTKGIQDHQEILSIEGCYRCYQRTQGSWHKSRKKSLQLILH